MPIAITYFKPRGGKQRRRAFKGPNAAEDRRRHRQMAVRPNTARMLDAACTLMKISKAELIDQALIFALAHLPPDMDSPGSPDTAETDSAHIPNPTH